MDDVDEILTEGRRPLPSLLQYVVDANPTAEDLIPPNHLFYVAEALERSRYEVVNICLSCPPQHGKTTLILSAIIWLLEQDERTHAYVTYSNKRAREMSDACQKIAKHRGLHVEGTLDQWRVGRGSVRFTSVDGVLMGGSVNGLLIIDDPYRTWREAYSPKRRLQVSTWFSTTARTRRADRTTTIVVHTRYHPSDLIGELHATGWKWVNLPALTEVERNEAGEITGGVPLAPAIHGLPYLLQMYRDPKLKGARFEALYQGDPQLAEGQLFGEPTYWTDPSPSALLQRLAQYRVGIGLDLSYAGKTRSDHSVALAVAESNAKHYLLDGIRHQVDMARFTDYLKRFHRVWGDRRHGGKMLFRGAAREEPEARLLRIQSGLPVLYREVKESKYTEALDTSLEWNAKRFLVPKPAPWNEAWLPETLRVITNFTGEDGDPDDDVDALVSARDLVPARAIVEKPRYMSPEWLRAEEASIIEQARRGVATHLAAQNRDARRAERRRWR